MSDPSNKMDTGENENQVNKNLPECSGPSPPPMESQEKVDPGTCSDKAAHKGDQPTAEKNEEENGTTSPEKTSVDDETGKATPLEKKQEDAQENSTTKDNTTEEADMGMTDCQEPAAMKKEDNIKNENHDHEPVSSTEEQMDTEESIDCTGSEDKVSEDAKDQATGNENGSESPEKTVEKDEDTMKETKSEMPGDTKETTTEKGAMRKTDSQAMAALDRQEDKVEKIKDGEKEEDLPTTLEGYKYAFNEDGEMRHIETNEGFVFKIKEDHSYNQKRYEAIGELITEYVYGKLESQCNLKRQYLPIDAAEGEPRSFIFMSEDAMTNTDKLMLLIHGSGVVRAGQWARRLIMNENLEKGTQIPYIERAIKEGYGVIVLNTNLNYEKIGDQEKTIKENGNPEKHANYVWKHFVANSAAKHIAIVAHSYGGIVATELAGSAHNFLDRVFAIAFTDSVHSLSYQDVPNDVIKFYKKNVINWVSSDEPLDTPMKHQPKKDAKRVSAGHPKHEWTSWACMESVFKLFTNKYAEALNPTVKDSSL